MENSLEKEVKVTPVSTLPKGEGIKTYKYSICVETGYEKETGCTGLWGGGCSCPSR